MKKLKWLASLSNLNCITSNLQLYGISNFQMRWDVVAFVVSLMTLHTFCPSEEKTEAVHQRSTAALLQVMTV
jgi:hypothetical protein